MKTLAAGTAFLGIWLAAGSQPAGMGAPSAPAGAAFAVSSVSAELPADRPADLNQVIQPLSPRRVDDEIPARSSGFRIVLLPAPSRLLRKQWHLRVSFPVTAAGPRRLCTVFP